MIKACIPLAIQVVIDDVGWWSGDEDSKYGGPYRNNIPRDHHPMDYRAIVELGKRLGMKPQAAFILCEWDRDNILREVPSSTWMGKEWDNSKWIGPWLDEAAQIIRDGSEYMEIVLHGIGHEFWEDGKGSRAEWHDVDGNLRPKDQIVLHIKYFKELLKQNDLGLFPNAFVPAAFLHRFGLGSEGISPILRENGIKYISTPFSSMFGRERIQGKSFGIDDGLLTVDRGYDLFNYCVLNPSFINILSQEGVNKGIYGSVCGMHWPNLLHLDPERNLEVVNNWVNYLQSYEEKIDRMLAPNTADSFSQVVYNWGTEVTFQGNITEFNFSKLDTILCDGILNYFFFKIENIWKPQKASVGLKIEPVVDKCTDKYSVYKIFRSSDCMEARVSWIISQ